MNNRNLTLLIISVMTACYIVAGVLVLVLYSPASSEDDNPDTTPTPTLTPTPDRDYQTLTLKDQEGQCLALTTEAEGVVLSVGNCANLLIEGSWRYNAEEGILISDTLQGKQSLCLLQPDPLTTRAPEGASTSVIGAQCSDIKVDLAAGTISSKGECLTLGTSFLWGSDCSAGSIYAFVITTD